MLQENSQLMTKWAPVLEGIDNEYTKKVTAQLLENQAKAILSEQSDRVDEAGGLANAAPTTVGKLGTFQKFAFPLVRRVYPQLIANSIVGVQPMGGPVSQIFYLGYDRVAKAWDRTESIYSKYQLTYAGMVASGLLESTGDGLEGVVTPCAYGNYLSSIDPGLAATVSATMGGQIAAFPDASTILGYSVSAGETLADGEIPEMNMHIEQQAVVARTRKMRALWTLEAAQDLRAYHNLDLEGELTDLLSKELTLEIDRELIEDLRMIAYDPLSVTGWNRDSLDNPNANNFGQVGSLGTPQGPAGDPATQVLNTEGFIPGDFLYDFANAPINPSGTASNVFLVDLSGSFLGTAFAPQHVGQVYANLLAVLNFASQDIYKTTMRGPGSWLITSPIVAAMLESASKLEGGVPQGSGPTNIKTNTVEYKGKFAGKYDLYVDPMYPEDEIMMGYKGTGPMDSGYVYCPYIPLQQLPTITDPATFQPRKGILTRYGKAAVTPESRFYRIIRLVGFTANYMFKPYATANSQSFS